MKNRDKLRRLKGRTEVAIGGMADEIVTLAITNNKRLVENYYYALLGACIFYAVAFEGKVEDGVELARQAVEKSYERLGLEPDEIVRNIW